LYPDWTERRKNALQEGHTCTKYKGLCHESGLSSLFLVKIVGLYNLQSSARRYSRNLTVPVQCSRRQVELFKLVKYPPGKRIN